MHGSKIGFGLGLAFAAMAAALPAFASPDVRFVEEARPELGAVRTWAEISTGAARVSLALDHPESCEVWGLATDGARMERVPAAAENGRLSFTAEVDSGRGARMFYEIARKSDP